MGMMLKNLVHPYIQSTTVLCDKSAYCSFVVPTTINQLTALTVTDSCSCWLHSQRFLSWWDQHATKDVLYCCGRTNFPWVIVMDGLIHCQYCAEAKKNAFSCNKFKKDLPRKHAITVDHCAAIKAKSGRRDMQHAIATMFCHQEKAARPHFAQSILWAKRIFLTIIFSDLKEFQVTQVSVNASMLSLIQIFNCVS